MGALSRAQRGNRIWGTYIVTRADQSITELPALVPSADVIGWEGRPAHRLQPGSWPLERLTLIWDVRLRSLSDQQLDERAGDAWTLRQVAFHVAESAFYADSVGVLER
jgi:hypothetical protein